MTRSAAVVALSVLAAAALPGAASAAPARVPPRAIFSSNTPTGANIGVSPLDEAITVLTTSTSGDSGPSLVGVVRGADGAIKLTQELSRSRGAQYPKEILFNNAGRSFLSWGLQPAFSATPPGEYTNRSAGGLFDAPTTWGDDKCRANSAVRFLPDGRPTVACSSISTTGAGPNRVIATDADQVSGETFSSGVVVQLPIVIGPASPRMDVGPDGTRAVAWSTLEPAPSGGSSNYLIKLAVAPPGSFFGPTETVATLSSITFGSLSINDVAVLADGRVAVAYTRDNGSALPALAQIRVRGSGASGSFGTETPVSTSQVVTYEVERDGQGAAVVWTEQSSDTGLQVVTKAASIGVDGTLSTPLALPDGAGSVLAQNLRVGPTGAASIGRIELGPVAGTVRPANLSAWVRPTARGSFTGPFPIGSTSEGQSIRDFNTTTDRHGSVAAVWVEGSDTSGKAFLGGLDAAGPELTSLSVPSGLRAGRAGRFAVRAVDPSGVKSIRWDFGDRTSASGSTTSHSFGARGRFRVTLTATDQAGVKSRASRVVTVTR